MKKVFGKASQYVLALFSIAVFGLLMSLTYQALQRVFPSFINQMWGMINFDIAVLCWAAIFIFACATTQQYAAAGIGFLVSFIGTLGMVAAEVILGQNLIEANKQQVGQWLVYGFIGMTAVHATLLWLHHFGAPEIKERMDVGIARGEITTEAIKQATNALDEAKSQLANSIQQKIYDDVLRELDIPIPVKGTPFDTKRQDIGQPDVVNVNMPPQEWDSLKQILAPFRTPKDESITTPAPFPRADSPSGTSDAPDKPK